ncbi:MAG TPA: XRE family transcriptional regulator [Solirubrobacteraceae bacterium]|jgi:transcriptional regulator with XRE-family HTH domain|nr:XRE family transcriptional regulator [Solirubrobacteraceae bacterium]
MTAAARHGPQSRRQRIPASAELGAAIRVAREDAELRLKDVADITGSSVSSIQGIEAGTRSVPAALLSQIAAVVRAETAALFREAGMVPDQVTAQLLAADVAGALAEDGLSMPARAALRQIHLTTLAERCAVPSRDPRVTAVDVGELLFKGLGYDTDARTDEERPRFDAGEFILYPARLDEAERRVERNWVLAHMAGHIILAGEARHAPRCAWQAGGALEAEADWIGGVLLLPRTTLVSTFQLIASKYDIDDPSQLGALMADVARRFDVPVWLAAHHVAAAGQLLWAAGGTAL